MDDYAIDVPLYESEIRLAIDGLGWMYSETAERSAEIVCLMAKLETFLPED